MESETNRNRCYESGANILTVAIIGSGNGGSATAAYLANKGHDVALFEPAPHVNPDHFNAVREQKGLWLEGIKGSGFAPLVNYGPDEINKVQDFDTLIIHYVTTYHRELSGLIAPFIRDGQTIIFNPGYLGTCTLYEDIQTLGLDPDITLIEFETLPFSARLTEPGKVFIRAENKAHPFALWPTHILTSDVEERLSEYVGECVLRNDVAEVSLHNPNLLIHTIGTVLNASRVEAEDKSFSMYLDGFSPSIWKVVHALDEEKMNVLEALGHPRRTYFEEFQLRTYGRVSMDNETAFAQFASGSFPGPFTLAHRYVTEDVPQGLGLLLALGEECGVPTPVCQSIITLAATMVPEYPIQQQIDRVRHRARRYLDYKRTAVKSVRG